MFLDEKREGEALLDLNKPSLTALSYILRRRELWPEGFIWDYSNCETCAIGLAVNLWEETKSHWDRGVTFEQTAATIMSNAFPISPSVVDKMFCARGGRNLPHSQITPFMVADDIDECLNAP